MPAWFGTTWFVVAAAGIVLLAAVVRRRFRPRGGFALADARALAHSRAVYRTTIFRFTTAFFILAFMVLAYNTAREGLQARQETCGTTSSGVVVLDMSGSLFGSPEVGRELQKIADRYARNRNLGIVLFSDTSAEALVSNGCSSDFREFIPYFLKPEREEEKSSTGTVISPWEAFSGGTVISSGLARALDVLKRDRVYRGTVVLISDLVNQYTDDEKVAEIIKAYERLGFTFRVVGIGSISQHEQAYKTAWSKDDPFVLRAEDFMRSVSMDEPEGIRAIPHALVIIIAVLGILFTLSALFPQQTGMSIVRRKKEVNRETTNFSFRRRVALTVHRRWFRLFRLRLSRNRSSI